MADRAVPNRGKLLLLLVAWPGFVLPSALAQANPVSTHLVAFEVSSIKLDKTDNRNFAPAFPRNGNGVTLEFMPLDFIVRVAYELRPDTVISGLPDWSRSAHYTIRAKVAESDVAEWKTYSEQMKKKVLQQLLADRFSLRMHTEAHEGSVYDLVVASGGIKMTAANPSATDHGGFIESYRPGVVKGHQLQMASFIQYLSGLGLGREIRDKTGLTGNYDFTLGEEPVDTSSPSGLDTSFLFTGLQQQLGLKLVPAKGQVVYYVVDRVERPSED